MYCGYCGRVNHRCACQAADSDIARFLARGGRAYIPKLLPSAPNWAVPPQSKRRERLTLKRNYRNWYRRLAASGVERCANCGAEDDLVLDHVIPVAKGGVSKLENLQLLCAVCNRIKGKLMIDCRDFRRRE